MFNKKKNQTNLLLNLELTPEYKEFSRLALMFATRYCMKHRKELKTSQDVKLCFDKGLKIYSMKKNKVDDLREVNNA